MDQVWLCWIEFKGAILMRSEMENDRNRTEDRETQRGSENYFFGSLGVAALVIGIAHWMLGGAVPSWTSDWRLTSFGWATLASLQLLTLFSLRRQLASFHLKRTWLIPLIMLWVGFDLPLALSRHDYIALPLAYGISQAIFLFNLEAS